MVSWMKIKGKPPIQYHNLWGTSYEFNYFAGIETMHVLTEGKQVADWFAKLGMKGDTGFF